MNIVILVTTKNIQEANKISRALLDRKLIACANVVKGLKSFFWWQGKIDNASEVLLIIKSKRSLFKKILKTVQSLHSYDVPEVIALPIIEGNKKYLKWISDSVE